EFVVCNSDARQAPRRWIKSQGFRNYVSGVRQAREIFQGGRAAAEELVELGVQLRFHAGILCQQPPGPGKRAGGSFMPGEKKRDGFIAELLVVHARTIFVLGVQKHGEKVSGVAARSAALVDDAVEDAFD